ncbi:MAG: hypothetical protein ACR2JL_03420, partial [Candidatus Limnocylindrus sp.]
MNAEGCDYAIVANVSEGRDAAIVAACAEAIRTTPGVSLLDTHVDADHDRSVFTYAASGNTEIAGAALSAATLRLAERTTATIDLRTPEKAGAGRGVHPRIGALDVVPVVPISATGTLKGAASIAREIAAALGGTGLPVHCYGAVARSEERRALMSIRRGEFEGLAARHATPEGAPDFGSIAPHPSAGAVAVGARLPMVAWNIELLAPSEIAGIDAARAIARVIRASGGGEQSVDGLQALGFLLARRGRGQVSMNLHDAAAAAERGDTLHAIRGVIAGLARAHGVELGESEIVGLAHERVLRAGGDP